MQPHVLALFRVELDAVYVSPFDGRRERAAVVGDGDDVFGPRLAEVGVVEIGPRPRRQAAKESALGGYDD